MSSKRPASSIGDCGCDIDQLPDRDFRIDLFRGISLWLIFLDHIPETYFNNFTPRNLGFSDAAEILVFLSGLASGFVYADVARRSGFAAASRRVLRRSFEIYFAQVVTVLLLLAEARLLAGWQAGLLDHANVAIFFSDPAQTALQLLSMRYSPVNLDPLLLMVILHFILVIVLPAMVRFPTTMLIPSAFLYFASHYFDWSIPAYPRGEIYFNPLNWQLLYLIGVWWGATGNDKSARLLNSNILATIAAAYLLFALLITLGWRFHALESYVPLAVSRLIYPIDKGNLDILRVLHFLALALIFRRLLPSHLSRPTVDALSPIIRCGEFSLVIYCSSVILSFAGHAVLSIGRNNLTTQTLVSIAGLVVLAVIADLLARNDRSGVCHPRTI